MISISFKTAGKYINDDPIFTLENERKKYLQVSWDSSRNRLKAELFTDGEESPFTINGPDDIKQTDFLITYNKVNFNLYISDILYDEEWPFGNIPDINMLKLNILQDDVLESINIDENPPNMPFKSCQDNYPDTMQYFCPPGFNTSAGDCMPYYHDGVYHLYYLYDRRHHGSKHGFGAHQWAHASTKDLIHWEHHGIALGVTDETEGSICTGSVIERNGKFYAFYAKRDIVDRCEKITYAVGDTPNHFEKTNRILYEFPSPPYVKGPGRDPFVYLGKDGLYHMMITARVDDNKNGNRGGCLAMLVSPDLENWELDSPYLPRYPGDPECSDFFEMNGWYYIIFSTEGVAKYRYSRSPKGPWLKPPIDVFDSPSYRVMKTAAFPGNRRISAAFLEKQFGHFGGNILFREIVQNSKGHLGTKLVPEMEITGKTVFSPDFDLIEESENNSISLNAPENFISFSVKSPVPHNFRLTCTIESPEQKGYYGIGFRNNGTFDSGHEIRFDTAYKTCQVIRAYDGYWHDNNKCSIYGLKQLDGAISLSLTVYDDIIDLCINNERTLCSRIDDIADKNGLFIYSHCMSVNFKNIFIQEL